MFFEEALNPEIGLAGTIVGARIARELNREGGVFWRVEVFFQVFEQLGPAVITIGQVEGVQHRLAAQV